MDGMHSMHNTRSILRWRQTFSWTPTLLFSLHTQLSFHYVVHVDWTDHGVPDALWSTSLDCQSTIVR